MRSLLLETVACSWLGILLAGCSPPALEPDHQPLWEIGEKQDLVQLGPEGRSFISAFDLARGRLRLVAILSPT